MQTFSPARAMLVLFVLTLLVHSVASFSTLPDASAWTAQRRVVGTSTCNSSTTTLSATDRRAFLQESLTVAAGLLILASSPLPAFAIEEADIITAKIASSQALRNVKTAQKKLASSGVAAYVSAADYESLKSVLRVEPISGVRKAGTVLVRAGQDRPEQPQLAQNLQASYKTFIAKLEKMDSLASVAMRGRSIAATDFQDSYDGAVSALNDFVTVAERSLELPVQ